MSGYSLNSFFSKVDLPVPDGPQITTGRNAAAAAAGRGLPQDFNIR